MAQPPEHRNFADAMTHVYITTGHSHLSYLPICPPASSSNHPYVGKESPSIAPNSGEMTIHLPAVRERGEE